ncbi:hypothetical protein OPS25_07720 [Alteromonas ponticola]|uniref:Uncharacterized protein n=1 Tax=Alteromonas aquimaris TaxID=2998417 RepID=A0ABT3P6J1_9ALTE|nr:hypothetical protein [Alteromonas aquimaris]MCW8108378.1 hypothetical protein [Alteromonas aquimaris]
MENSKVEQSEVLLTNLIALQDINNEKFTIPHDDVVVTLKTVISLLVATQSEVI